MKRKIPVFKTEKQERKFWSHADSAVYVDWKKARNVKFPNLKAYNANNLTKASRINASATQSIG